MRSSIALILSVLVAVSGFASGGQGPAQIEEQQTAREQGVAEIPDAHRGLTEVRSDEPDLSGEAEGLLGPFHVTNVSPAPDGAEADGDAGFAGSAEGGGDGGPAGSEDGTAAPGTSTSDQGFSHPGVFVTRENLDAMRSRVASGEEPWKSKFDRLLSSKWGTLGYRPSPRAIVECGGNEDVNNGCHDERRDAHAAYAHALAWYATQDERYAQEAIEIMNAWSSTIEDHTNVNAHLQAGWAGAIWPRAAEIIRYTYGGWPAGEVERFEDMLRTVYLPEVSVRDYANGNWELAMTEAAIAIAVFTDDRTAYRKARAVFLDRSRAYVYLDSDGDMPTDATGSPYEKPWEIVDFWRDGTFGEGQAQETCRDLNHASLGLWGMAHTLTTTRIQGDNLYGKVGRRFAEAAEMHARVSVTGEVPSWLCGGSVTGSLEYLPDSALTVLTRTYGCRMPYALEHNLSNQLPYGSSELLTAWEPLTHGIATPPTGEISPTVCPR